MAESKTDFDPKYDNFDFPTTSPVAQSGHPGHTTAEQNAQVFQLRTVLEQEGYKERLDTLRLLRFLRARKFNVELSKKMFVDCETWRKEFGVDDLMQNFEYKEKAEVFKYYPQFYHKTDKDGRPVYIEQLGKVDLTAMYKITTQDRMLQNLVVEYEKLDDPRLPACSRKAGHLLETCCTIMDLKGVGLTKAGSVYGYVQRASAISQNYYPERLGKLYVINAPWGFSTVFSVVKSFLDPVTVNKIHVLGSGYHKELVSQVAEENLPDFLGGACVCGDHGGCMFSDMGPWQDPQYVKEPAWAKKGSGTEEAKGTITQLPQSETTVPDADAGKDGDVPIKEGGEADAKVPEVPSTEEAAPQTKDAA